MFQVHKKVIEPDYLLYVKPSSVTLASTPFVVSEISTRRKNSMKKHSRYMLKIKVKLISIDRCQK